ncbi:MAG: HEPN domain-containing protein [Chloroflexi bacterium]|nr:HEPN domain-containing protein [Chloroflexota bacterium]
MPERSADWLAQAERDLEMARLALQGGIYEWACFVSQQAAEKAVKALYESLHGTTRGHSVSRLLQLLPAEVAPPVELLDKARTLDQYYIQPRNPNGFDVGAPKDYYTQENATLALEHAKTIVEFCRGMVSRRS